MFSTTPQGQPNGSVWEEMFFFVPGCDVINESGAVEYRVSLPTSMGGICVDVCAEGLCNCRVSDFTNSMYHVL